MATENILTSSALENVNLVFPSVMYELTFSKAAFVKIFSIATSQTHFLVNYKVFDQIDGVAMDSPLAPVLANLFLGHHENIWLKNYQGPSNVFYRRYVDYILYLVLFDDVELLNIYMYIYLYIYIYTNVYMYM